VFQTISDVPQESLWQAIVRDLPDDPASLTALALVALCIVVIVAAHRGPH